MRRNRRPGAPNASDGTGSTTCTVHKRAQHHGPLGRGELIIRGGGGVSVLTENQESILRQCLSAADLASPTTRDLSRCWGDFVVAGWETPWGLIVCT